MVNDLSISLGWIRFRRLPLLGTGLGLVRGWIVRYPPRAASHAPGQRLGRDLQQTARLQPLAHRAGMRVRHPSWEEGMVLNSKIEDGDEVVDVFFEGVGMKKLMASLAQLEVIEG